MNITWDAAAYHDGFSFVPTYGAQVMGLIDALPGSTCLDLGCGNGELTAQLAERGYAAVGMDMSAEMLAAARSAHPDLCFIKADATSFELDEPVDVVFSNAMLHWVDKERHPAMLACVACALKPGGQFVFECGGYGCCAIIHEALASEFAQRGLVYRHPFWFPTVGEYAPLVEAAGMRVTDAFLFERPTVLAENGVAGWIRMFVKTPFAGMDPREADEIVECAAGRTRESLCCDDVWYADYVRLRMRAVKR